MASGGRAETGGFHRERYGWRALWGFAAYERRLKQASFIIKHHQGRLKKHVKHQSSGINGKRRWNFYQSHQTSSTSSIIHWKSMQLLWYQFVFFHGVFPTLSQVLKALPPPAKAVKIVATVMALKGFLDTWKTRKNRLHQKKDSLLTLPAQQESYQLKKVL